MTVLNDVWDVAFGEASPATAAIADSTEARPLEEGRLEEGRLEEGRLEEGRLEEGRPRVRLLCAEDNEINQMVLTALLEPYDYDLVMVDNGRQALEAYMTQTFDLILLDIQMPVMDGPSAAAAIRLYDAQTNRPETPIIALTANVMADQVQSYLASGMNQVIPKPINIDDLYAAIQRHLTRTASSDQSSSADRSSPRLAARLT